MMKGMSGGGAGGEGGAPGGMVSSLPSSLPPLPRALLIPNSKTDDRYAIGLRRDDEANASFRNGWRRWNGWR